MVDGALGRGSPGLPGVIGARLRRRRWLLLAVAAILVVLFVADHVSALGALLALAVLAAAIGAIPDETTADDPLPGNAANLPDGLLPGTRLFAQSLPDPCFILARDGTVRYANDRAVAVFGIRQGDRLPFRMRYPELIAAFDRVVAGDGPQRVDFVERIPTERWFSAWFAAIDESGRPETILLVIDDQTAARATERMRADFVANASHELRTPLASLAGFIETLQGPAKDDPAARERFLGIMHDQATRMSRLINDLLSLSRVEMNAHVPPRGRVDLVSVLGHVIDTMAPVAAENEIRIEAELPDGEVLVTGDRDELVQVFDNLVENACKYGRAGGRVVVRLDAAEHRGPATVSVIDFGPGIAPEHVPRLTERFYRVDADDSRRHRGTGLGLAIVKHIATRHRARLQIESTPGQGARFSIYFPSSETVHTANRPKPKDGQQVALS
ncbi:MAG: PAS domain-containing protein [Bauldia sp.]|nr:PAS domain-containing protein [Bauldia sp.]